jgi:5-methylcytosine-specific restriction endonuclease McrA
MKIKKYIEYIIEMERFKSNSSRTGSTKEYDVIFDEPSSAKSPSAGIMLKNLLKKKEFEEELGRSFTLSDLTNATKEEKKRYKLEIAINNLGFLNSEAKKGELRCEYCNEGLLTIYGFGKEFRKEDGATADHKIPISKGGPIFTYDNLAVACYDCNNKKSDIDYDVWLKMVADKQKLNESVNIKLLTYDDFHSKFDICIYREKFTDSEIDIFHDIRQDELIKSYYSNNDYQLIFYMFDCACYRIDKYTDEYYTLYAAGSKSKFNGKLLLIDGKDSFTFRNITQIIKDYL